MIGLCTNGVRFDRASLPFQKAQNVLRESAASHVLTRGVSYVNTGTTRRNRAF